MSEERTTGEITNPQVGFRKGERVAFGPSRATGTVIGHLRGWLAVRYDSGIIRWEAPAYLQRVAAGVRAGQDLVGLRHPDHGTQQIALERSRYAGPVHASHVKAVLQGWRVHRFRTAELAMHPVLLQRYPLLATQASYLQQVEAALAEIAVHESLRRIDGPEHVDGALWEKGASLSAAAAQERAANEDWLQIMHWDLRFNGDPERGIAPEITTPTALLRDMGVLTKGRRRQRGAIAWLMQLPIAERMPEHLREALIRQGLYDPNGKVPPVSPFG